MNFGELKTRVLEYAFRTGDAIVTAQVGGFVALAEGMIRRELTAMPLTIELDETDRDAAGVYNLPAAAVQVRAIFPADDGEQYALHQVSLEELRRLPSTANPINFCVVGSTIEIRGVPETDATFTLHYLGHPVALDGDSDENDLLTNHEALYVYGALFHLYQFTQDPELAQGALETFRQALERLNTQVARKLGGARIAGAYHFGPIGRHGY